MSTTAAAQPVLTVVKDKFAEVITEGTLFPTNALWDPWGLFFIHLTHESGISNYKGMNSGDMNLR
jgi:hypothetical protein